MIKLNQLIKTFDRVGKSVTVLNDISVEFQHNSTYAITGPSGSGKSTLLHLIAGLEQPTSGKILLDNKDISCASEKEHAFLLQKTFGLVFQYPHLIPELTVAENVAIKGLIVGMSEKERLQHACELLDLVGLAEYASQQPLELSGGEQQRVALVRSLFIKPKFLLADEPTAHLDATSARSIISLIKTFQREYGMGVIICSHDPAVAKEMDNVLKLDHGKLV